VSDPYQITSDHASAAWHALEGAVAGVGEDLEAVPLRWCAPGTLPSGAGTLSVLSFVGFNGVEPL
jgi:hypothetical protein